MQGRKALLRRWHVHDRVATIAKKQAQKLDIALVRSDLHGCLAFVVGFARN
jgi:hypothetical protein